MARDGRQAERLEDLSDAEIERIEGVVFCAGGPPRELARALLERASQNGKSARRG